MVNARLGWMAAGAAVRFASKRYTIHRIDQATIDLTNSLPTPLIRAAERLPGDLPRIGGAAIVAGTGAARVARSTVAVTRATGRVTRRAGAVTSQVRGAVDLGVIGVQHGTRGLAQLEAARRRLVLEKQALQHRFGDVRSEVRDEIEQQRRQGRSSLLAETRGPGAALEALLDQRSTEPDPLPSLPSAIPIGRRRSVPALPAAPVGRVQRSYRPPERAWDRPARRR